MSQEIAVLSQEKAASSGQAVPAANPANVGQWSAVIPLANVPIHTHLLPTALRAPMILIHSTSGRPRP
jgi:hypothetical protein